MIAVDDISHVIEIFRLLKYSRYNAVGYLKSPPPKAKSRTCDAPALDPSEKRWTWYGVRQEKASLEDDYESPAYRDSGDRLL